MKPFCARETCAECPWRKDVPVGRFPPERFVRLRNTTADGFAPIFACHKTVEGKDLACVGYLLVGAEDNLHVRLALRDGRFDPRELVATGPLFESYEAMASANGAGVKESNE